MKDSISTLSFTGKSGTAYKFYIYPLPYSFLERKGGIYLYTKFLDNNFHVPIYLGITGDLRTLFKDSQAMKNIIKSHPTHICVSLEEDASKREFAEEDLSEIAQTHSDVRMH